MIQADIERALALVKVQETEPSSEQFRERERMKRFIADSLAVKSKKPVICEQMMATFGGRWTPHILDTFIRRHLTQNDLDEAVERFQTGEIRGKVVVQKGKTVFIVEPETQLDFGPHGNHATVKPLASKTLKHRASQLLALDRSLKNAMLECAQETAKLQDAILRDNVTEGMLHRVEEAYRAVLQAIYPVAVSALVDIKDRDARLGILGTIAFDSAVDPPARIKAVETSSRILGDFQRARSNEADTNLRAMAERIVAQGISRTGLGREEVVKMLAADVPEIIQWLQTKPTSAT